MNAKLPYKKPVPTKKEKPMFEKHHEENQQAQQAKGPAPKADPSDALVKAIESKAAEYDDPRLSSVSGPSVAAMLRSLIAQHVPAKE